MTKANTQVPPELTDEDQYPGEYRRWLGSAIGIVVVMVVSAVLAHLVWSNPIEHLAADQARVQAFLSVAVLVATVGIGMLLATQAFFTTIKDPEAENRYKRAREIFTALVGVLGTVVGFYFGAATADRQAPSLDSETDPVAPLVENDDPGDETDASADVDDVPD